MSHLDELDEFEAEAELRLKKEYGAVFGLFRYCVLTQDATYLCNKLDLQYVWKAAIGAPDATGDPGAVRRSRRSGAPDAIPSFSVRWQSR